MLLDECRRLGLSDIQGLDFIIPFKDLILNFILINRNPILWSVSFLQSLKRHTFKMFLDVLWGVS